MPKLDGVLSDGTRLNGRQGPERPQDVAPPRELLAVSLKDLMRLSPDMRTRLVKDGDQPRLDLSQTVSAGRDGDPAVVFRCSLLSAAMVCDVVRSQDREASDQPAGVYISRGSSWQRVPNSVSLTTVGEDGKVSLNPEVFRAPVVPLPVRAPRVEVVEL